MAVLLVLALLVLAPLAPRAFVSRPMLRPVSCPRALVTPRRVLGRRSGRRCKSVSARREIFRPSSEIRVISRGALTDLQMTRGKKRAAGGRKGR